MTKENLEKACSKILEKNKDILNIILGGSRARGDNRKDSDYDLMFITKKGSSYDLSKKYERLVASKIGVDNSNVGILLLPTKKFELKRSLGNSFVYNTLKYGKILASRKEIDRKLPENLVKGAKERLNLAKRDIDYAKFNLYDLSKNVDDINIGEIGYAAMHLCWTVCMLHNFCPKSKYTVLNESRKYFTEKEFETIKQAYKFYSHPNFDRKIKGYEFLNILRPLTRIIDKNDKILMRINKSKIQT